MRAGYSAAKEATVRDAAAVGGRATQYRGASISQDAPGSLAVVDPVHVQIHVK